MKVVCVGDAGVEKTCLIHYAVFRTFLEQCRPTIYAGFEKLTVGEPPNQTNLELWDTAGQEVYRSLAPQFFKQASAAVFVFDLTRPETMAALPFYRDALA
jgi:small GTP-binding protein